MKKQFTLLKLFFFVLLFFSAPFSYAQSLPHPDHVVVVIEENHAFSQIIGSSSAPYINQLADSGALFIQSHGLTHPSQPNYLMFYSGGDQGINGVLLSVYGDNYPSGYPWYLTLPFTTKNLGACLIQNGMTFTGYAEDLPSVGYLGATSGNYASKHAVYTYWQGTGANSIPASDNQPLTSFPTNFNNLPTVAYVIPNLNDDMHNGTGTTPISDGDTWLKNHMDAYIQWAKTHNSLFILTFDEDDDIHNNQIATIFDGAMVKTGQYSDSITHYNVLRTIEDMYGLCHAANDSLVTPITDCWLTSTGVNGNLKKTENGFGVYPNPAVNGRFTVSEVSIAKDTQYELTVYNALGGVVYRTAVNSKQQQIILQQPDGMYFLKIKTNRGVFVRKLILQNGGE